MDNNIYMPIKGNVVYTKTIDKNISTESKQQLVYDGINAKGKCLIVVGTNYASVQFDDSVFEFSDIMIGDKPFSDDFTLIKDRQGTVYAYAGIHIMFADLTGVDTISFYATRVVHTTMKIFEL